jgi:hypothetical protein
MPSAKVLASIQHMEDCARTLRDVGVPSTWEEFKVRATVDLLHERDSRPSSESWITPTPGDLVAAAARNPATRWCSAAMQVSQRTMARTLQVHRR